MTITAERKSTAEEGKYLTFFLGGEEFGLEILKVREIIGMLPITRVPRMPEAIRGVVNLRGKVIPVVDLRLKFDLPAGFEDRRTCVIIVSARGVELGLVVDAVSEVADVRADEIEPAPDLGDGMSTEFLRGIARSSDRVKLLLDIERVLSPGERQHIDRLEREHDR